MKLLTGINLDVDLIQELLRTLANDMEGDKAHLEDFSVEFDAPVDDVAVYSFSFDITTTESSRFTSLVASIIE